MRRQALGLQPGPAAEPQLRVLPGELRRDPEGRAVLLPGQPGVPRRRRHEPLLRRQRQAPLELLLQQLGARGALRSQLWILHLLLVDDRRLLTSLATAVLHCVQLTLAERKLCSAAAAADAESAITCMITSSYNTV